MFHCPLSGNPCFNPKVIQASHMVNGDHMQILLCQECAQITNHQNPLLWQKFLHAILHLLRVDEVLNEEDLAKALVSIKNTDELNSFLRTLNKQDACPSCGL